jgi:hypothetical protein
MKENKLLNKHILLLIIYTLLILAVLSAIFYWFAYRPSEIRKACYVESGEAPRRIRDDEYKRCLMKNGLKIQGY